jgi:hypothetical protein
MYDMPKFTCTERLTVKNIVAMLTIKRIPDSEIIKSIFDQTGKTTTVSNLTRIKQEIKRDSYHWYKTMREGEYEYIHEFRERINEILDLQKRHYEIADPMIPIPIKQASLFELHKLTVTLSNLFDVAPYITNSNNNNATLSTPSENKTTGTEATASYVV